MLGELILLSCVHEYDKEHKVLLSRRPDKNQLEEWKRELCSKIDIKMHKQIATLRRLEEKVLGCT